MKALLLIGGSIAAFVALVNPTHLLHQWGSHLAPLGPHPTSAQPLSPAAWAEHANAICASLGQNMPDLPQTATGGAEMQDVIAAAVSVQQRIDALPLPKNRGLAKAWVAGYDRFVALLGKFRDAAQRNDVPAALRIGADLYETADREHQLSLKLGMNDCT